MWSFLLVYYEIIAFGYSTRNSTRYPSSGLGM